MTVMALIIKSRTPPNTDDGVFWLCEDVGEMYLRCNGSWILYRSVPLALMQESGAIVPAAP
jgi:hypothetical protein